jgi:hypothetical protein
MYNVSVGTFGPDKASGPQPVKNSHHRNFLSKNDKYYLFYENLCYICSREIRNRCKMQQKKSLKLRLLVIYITFFVVLIASVVYNFLPDFSRGTDVGTNIGNEIAQSWNTQNPRATYLLMDVPTLQPEMDTPIEGVADSEEMTVKARITRMDILVEKKAPAETSVFSLAFGVLGGSPAVYLLTILGAFSYAAIIVLMFLIIHSLRRSIRDELPLNSRNIGRTRLIGALIIFAEVCRAVSLWLMNGKAAELLAGTDIIIDTSFPISYWNILIGVLVLFTAEVFAIGYRLSEEQKLTI